MNHGDQPEPPVRIEGPYLLLVEGKDEVLFFDALLRHMGVNEVQILHSGGKRNLPRRFPAIALQLDHVRAYAVVQDADASAENTFRSIRGILTNHGEPCPKMSGRYAQRPGLHRRVGVYVLPGAGRSGMLEDLCLLTVSGHPAMPCVSDFMGCLRRVLAKGCTKITRSLGKACYPNNPSKAQALAFMAAMKFEVHRVGEAAQQRCWNFNHPCMANLKRFLSAMVET
jgi:hypothetical protein